MPNLYTAQLRHAQHYLEVIRNANDLYIKGGDSIIQGLTLFDLERVNTEHGQKWASENSKNDDVAQVCNDYPNAGIFVINLRLHSRQQIRWMEGALNAARQLKDRQYEGAHFGNLGLAYADLGEMRKAIKFYEQALIIDREIGDRHGEGIALGNLGSAYFTLGEYEAAIEYYKKRLAIDQEIEDRSGQGNALWGLAICFEKDNDLKEAIAYAEQALEIFAAIESPSAKTMREMLERWKKPMSLGEKPKKWWEFWK